VKVLISAFSVNPTGSSEQGVGWNWAVQASRHHEVWVLTNTAPEDAVAQELQARPNPNLHFVFHRGPREHALRSLGRKFHLFYYPAYLSWQASAIGAARKLHAEVGFDVTQHLTWASCRFPSALAWLDVPFIWGPIGGGEVAPRSAYTSLGLRPAFGEVARETSNWLTRLDPFVRHTATRAARILTTTEETKALLPAGSASKAEVYPAIGLRLNELDQALAGSLDAQRSANGDARLLFVGRLVSWKGCEFAIRAVAELARSGTRASLTVVGVGPELSALRTLARDLGVESQVEFLGTVPHNEVLALFQTHDVFLFPSLHDSGGIAVLEAMYLGLPVVCLDLGGPAVSVGDAGIRVPCEDVQQIVNGLTDGVRRLLSDEALRKDIVTRARSRVVELYDWDSKAEYISDLYESVAKP